MAQEMSDVTDAPVVPHPAAEPRTDATKDRIVRAAAKLFLARSYHSVGVNEICEAAKVKKGSFYHFFESKSDLAIAVIDHHARAMWRMLDEHERAARGPVNKMRATAQVTRTVHEGLVKVFGRVVGCPLGNLALELATTADEAGKHAANVLAEWEARIAGHGRDAEEVGLLAPGTDPDELAHVIIATMQGMILLAKVSNSAVTPIYEAMDRAIDHGVRRI